MGVLVYVGALVLLRKWGNAAPVASLVLLVLLSYGRLYDGLKAAGLSGETVVRHRYLIPLCVVIVGIGAVWAARRRETAGLNRVLNLMSVIVVALPLVSIGIYEANTLRSVRTPGMDCTLEPPGGQVLPDVYLIIMDAYTCDDVLRDVHGYDNSPFLELLEEMGFYVARGSLSNYRPTIMSISSMLNMAYIQDYPSFFGRARTIPGTFIGFLGTAGCAASLSALGM